MGEEQKKPTRFEAFTEKHPGCYVQTWKNPRSKSERDAWVAVIWEPAEVVLSRPRFILAFVVADSEEAARARLDAFVLYAERFLAAIEHIEKGPMAAALLSALHDAQWRKVPKDPTPKDVSVDASIATAAPAAKVAAADVCGQKCGHGSECLLPPNHGGGHETQHGCIFYDERSPS